MIISYEEFMNIINSLPNIMILDENHILENFGVSADKASIEFINTEIDKLREEKKLKCTTCGSSDITPAKTFTLMVKSNFGSATDVMTEEKVD